MKSRRSKPTVAVLAPEEHLKAVKEAIGSLHGLRQQWSATPDAGDREKLFTAAVGYLVRLKLADSVEYNLWLNEVCDVTDVTQTVLIDQINKAAKDYKVTANAAVEPTEPTLETIVRHLNEFHADDEAAAANTLLGKRYLCRGGALLWAGPTGVGKSSFAYQAGIQWALGKPFFGICPSKPLLVLIVQAENDDGDVAEIRDGVFRGLKLTSDECAEACRQVQVVCETIATGEKFVARLEHLVVKHKPDLLIIDPLFAYCGCDVSDQKYMSQFLRNGLNPILQAHKCGLILVHHTNKPQPGRERAAWKAGDFAYLGSGTGDIANWARGVIGIRSIGSHKVFEIVLGKRGKRAGLVDDQGEPIYSFSAKHATGGICWDTANDDDLTALGKKPRPGAEDLLALIPVDSDIGKAKLINAASEKGIGKNRCNDLLAELIEDGKVFKRLTPRPGTNAAVSYSRHQLPERDQ